MILYPEPAPCQRRLAACCLHFVAQHHLRDLITTGTTYCFNKQTQYPNRHFIHYESPYLPPQLHICIATMSLKHLHLILASIILLSLPTCSLAFITSPMDWAFARNHSRGLVCPSLRYGCCPDLATWRHGTPCEHPKATESPDDCYKRKEWACCRDDVCRCGMALWTEH